jgi:hypothetical protein
MSALSGVFDGLLWLHKVERGVHRRYLEQLRVLAGRTDELSPEESVMVELLLRKEEWERMFDGDD